jgi:hypothetical protein
MEEPKFKVGDKVIFVHEGFYEDIDYINPETFKHGTILFVLPLNCFWDSVELHEQQYVVQDEKDNRWLIIDEHETHKNVKEFLRSELKIEEENLKNCEKRQVDIATALLRLIQDDGVLNGK